MEEALVVNMPLVIILQVNMDIDTLYFLFFSFFTS